MPGRTIALALAGLAAGLMLFETVSPNLYIPYIPHRGEGVLFAVSLVALFLLFNFAHRLRWWAAMGLFTVTGFVFLVTLPIA